MRCFSFYNNLENCISEHQCCKHQINVVRPCLGWCAVFQRSETKIGWGGTQRRGITAAHSTGSMGTHTRVLGQHTKKQHSIWNKISGGIFWCQCRCDNCLRSFWIQMRLLFFPPENKALHRSKMLVKQKYLGFLEGEVRSCSKRKGGGWLCTCFKRFGREIWGKKA